MADGRKFASFDFAVTIGLDYSAARYEIGPAKREGGANGGVLETSEKRRELHNSVYDIRSHC